MAEYVYPQDQTVQDGQNVLFMDSIPCNKGYVIHRNGSGILTLRGIVNNPCARFARYFPDGELPTTPQTLSKDLLRSTKILLCMQSGRTKVSSNLKS